MEFPSSGLDTPLFELADGMSSNVQVTLRVKPRSDKESVILEVPEDKRIVVVVDRPFAFDHVVWENGSQEQVYKAAAGQMVEKALQGYNATVLAYGQTGTGKTYTMGSISLAPDHLENTGLIQRCLSRIFQQKETRVFISFMEIYNEELHDLLNMRHRLHTRNGGPTPRIQGVDTFEESLDVVGKALKSRQTNATKLNPSSSRSHALLTLYLKMQNGEKLLESKLNLVDLAGSESVKKTEAKGMAFYEGCKINKSLLALSNVISTLAKNTPSTYVSYRNSMLTSTLQDSLGGKSLISLVACVSPDPVDLYESATTMRFTESAKMVKTKPELNFVLRNFLEKNKAEIKRLSMIVSPVSEKRSTIGAPTKFSSVTPSVKRRKNHSTPAPKRLVTPLKTPGIKDRNEGNLIVPLIDDGISTSRNKQKAILTTRSKKNPIATPQGSGNTIASIDNGSMERVVATPSNKKNITAPQTEGKSFALSENKKHGTFTTSKATNEQESKAALLKNKENRTTVVFKTPGSKKIVVVQKTARSAIGDEMQQLPIVVLDRVDLGKIKNSKNAGSVEGFLGRTDRIMSILRDTTNVGYVSMGKDNKTFPNVSPSLNKTPQHAKNINLDENDILSSFQKQMQDMRTELNHLRATVLQKKSTRRKINTKDENLSPFNEFKVPELPISKPRRSIRLSAKLAPIMGTPIPLPRLSLQRPTPKLVGKVTTRKCLVLNDDWDIDSESTSGGSDNAVEPTTNHGNPTTSKDYCDNEMRSNEGTSGCSNNAVEEPTMNHGRPTRFSLKRPSIANAATTSQQIDSFHYDRSSTGSKDYNHNEMHSKEGTSGASNNAVEEPTTNRGRPTRISFRIQSIPSAATTSQHNHNEMHSKEGTSGVSNNAVEEPTTNRGRPTRFSLKRQSIASAATTSQQINLPDYDRNVEKRSRTRSSFRNSKMQNDLSSADDGILPENGESTKQPELKIDDENRMDEWRTIEALDLSSNSSVGANDEREAVRSDQSNNNRRRSLRLTLKRQSINELPKEQLPVPKKRLKTHQTMNADQVERVPRPENMTQDVDEPRVPKKALSEKQVAHNKKILKILNEGTVAQLKDLPRIGPKTAMVIYQYRELNGKFNSFKDLKKAPMLTKALVSKLLLANNVVLD